VFTRELASMPTGKSYRQKQAGGFGVSILLAETLDASDAKRRAD